MHAQLVARQAHPEETNSFRGFALPTSNTTYCPNQFFDVCLPNGSRGCMRLVAYLLRKTLGWSDEHGHPQIERHRVTYQELITKAGISRDMVRAAIDEAVRGHFIVQVQLGRPNSAGLASLSSLYELKWDERGEYVKDPKHFRGFFAGEGNRTYIPNQFFDCVVRNETLAVVKVVSSVIRFSIGFQTKWGHRRQQFPLSYQDIQNYAHLANRNSLSAAIRMALARNYLERVEDGVFDPNAGRLSRPAVYALKWLNEAATKVDGQKNVPEDRKVIRRSENRTGNGQKNVPGERSEKRTDIQITERNNTSKQQPPDVAAAFSRLTGEGFDVRAAEAMASRFTLERIERQIRWIDQRHVKTNRVGMLRTAIEEDWSAPSTPGRGAQLGRPNWALTREGGTSFADALKRAGDRLVTKPTSKTP